MKQQMSFAQSEYAGKKKVTRREKFLGEMERVVPWARLCGVIEPHYPQGRRGRPPMGIERMLRIYFLQQWYALADEALEDALYDSQAMRTFAGIDLRVEAVPDATTLLKFRHLLEAHDLTRATVTEVNGMLRERKLLMREGTRVDATIIAAPSSTKNARKERDPEMHQTRKGNQWHFGMKAHIGADAKSGLVHGVSGTAANVADIAQTRALLHGEEKKVRADAGYVGVEKRGEIVAQGKEVPWYVAAKRTNNASGSTVTATVNALNQLTAGLGFSSFTHDRPGNLTFADKGSFAFSFSYDHENQCVSAGGYYGPYKSDFVYDGKGRLRKRTDYAWNGSSWSCQSETRYV